MNPTLENAIEIIRKLPQPEREKFFDWAEEEKHKELAEKNAGDKETRKEDEKFRLAVNWIEKNRREFLGQWVCLDGDKLIASGEDGLQVYAEAKERGIKVPFVEHITEDKEYGGGIEA